MFQNPPRESTHSLALGSCIHECVLQSEEFQLPPDVSKPTAKLGKVIDYVINKYGEKKVCDETGLGEATLKDVVADLLKPGRDLRDSLPKPILRGDIMDINDLAEGMEITGTVRNVIDFGAFVDIGVHQDGLVHISELSDNYVRHPSDVLKVGQIVKVRVIGVDKKKNRIALSMRKQPEKKS